jgi:hypothetical protein
MMTSKALKRSSPTIYRIEVIDPDHELASAEDTLVADLKDFLAGRKKARAMHVQVSVVVVGPGGEATPIGESRASKAGSRSFTVESSLARGEAQVLKWIQDGTLMPVSDLAQAWGITRQSIDDMRKAGKLFSLYAKGQHWYPKEVLNFRRDDLARVVQALGDVGAVTKLLFLLKPHGALRKLTPAQAIDKGMLDDVVRIAGAVARD